MEMNQTFVCLTQIRVPLQDVPVQKQLAISWSSPVTMIHPTYLRQKTDCDAQGINQTFQCYKRLFPKSQHFVHRYLKVDSPIHPCKLSHIPSSQPENVKLFGSQNTNTGHGHDGLASLSLSTLHCAKSTVATRCGCIPVLWTSKVDAKHHTFQKGDYLLKSAKCSATSNCARCFLQQIQTHTIHVWYVYIYMHLYKCIPTFGCYVFLVNVGTSYTIHMDAMGNNKHLPPVFAVPGAGWHMGYQQRSPLRRGNASFPHQCHRCRWRRCIGS